MTEKPHLTTGIKEADAYDWNKICGLVINDQTDELIADETLPAYTIWRLTRDSKLLLVNDNRRGS